MVDRRGVRVRSQMPEPSIARLPAYLRVLLACAAREEHTISSYDLSVAIGANAATVRRDLSRLGSFGTRGSGYDVQHLLRRVEDALAVREEWRVAIVGAGSLGRALALSQGFNSGGFVVASLVDVDRSVIGSRVGAIEVSSLESLESMIRSERISIGVIATPASSAQDVALRLSSSGVTLILNFAPTAISVPESVRVRRVDLGAELQVLAFYGASERSC